MRSAPAAPTLPARCQPQHVHNCRACDLFAPRGMVNRRGMAKAAGSCVPDAVRRHAHMLGKPGPPTHTCVCVCLTGQWHVTRTITRSRGRGLHTCSRTTPLRSWLCPCMTHGERHTIAHMIPYLSLSGLIPPCCCCRTRCPTPSLTSLWSQARTPLAATNAHTHGAAAVLLWPRGWAG